MGVKICPDCGGKVSDSRNECIHCGYVFPLENECPKCEEVNENVDVTEGQVEHHKGVDLIEEKDGKAICPYCGEKEEHIELGNKYYMCSSCKNKFFNATVVRGCMKYVKTKENVSNYSAEDNESVDVVAEKSKKSCSPKTREQDSKKTVDILVVIFGVFLVLGIAVNIIIASIVWSYLAAMFDYWLAGYIAGFIITGISFIMLCILVPLAIRARKKFAVIFSVIMFIVTVVLFVISALNDKGHTHYYRDEYTAPTCEEEGYLYRVCSCGDRYFSRRIDVLGHDYSGHVCIRCGSYDYTEGLTFIINDDYSSYSVSYYGGTDSNVFIPPVYEGLPVTRIGAKVFQYKNIVSIDLPESITTIGEHAFFNCTALRNITLPDGLLSIEYTAFTGCSNLVNVEIPSSVIHIGNGAFDECGNLKYNLYAEGKYLGNNANPYLVFVAPVSQDITSFVINPQTKIISYRAFWCCYDLEEVSIPNSIISVADAYFGYHLQYTQYDNALYLGNVSNPYLVLVSAVSKDITTCQINTQTKVIYAHAFENCRKLKNISIPSSVKSIEAYAFSGCSELTNLTIPEGVLHIGDGAFSYCDSLTSITIPESVTSIGYGALLFIYYAGTEEQWKKISISSMFKYYDITYNSR